MRRLMGIMLTLSSFAAHAESKIELECKTDATWIRVSSAAEKYSLQIWKTSSKPSGQPSEEITGGRMDSSGSGSCNHSEWIFHKDKTDYVVSELGCGNGDEPKGTVALVSIGHQDTEDYPTEYCLRTGENASGKESGNPIPAGFDGLTWKTSRTDAINLMKSKGMQCKERNPILWECGTRVIGEMVIAEVNLGFESGSGKFISVERKFDREITAQEIATRLEKYGTPALRCMNQQATALAMSLLGRGASGSVTGGEVCDLVWSDADTEVVLGASDSYGPNHNGNYKGYSCVPCTVRYKMRAFEENLRLKANEDARRKQQEQEDTKKKQLQDL